MLWSLLKIMPVKYIISPMILPCCKQLCSCRIPWVQLIQPVTYFLHGHWSCESHYASSCNYDCIYFLRLCVVHSQSSHISPTTKCQNLPFPFRIYNQNILHNSTSYFDHKPQTHVRCTTAAWKFTFRLSSGMTKIIGSHNTVHLMYIDNTYLHGFQFLLQLLVLCR